MKLQHTVPKKNRKPESDRFLIDMSFCSVWFPGKSWRHSLRHITSALKTSHDDKRPQPGHKPCLSSKTSLRLLHSWRVTLDVTLVRGRLYTRSTFCPYSKKKTTSLWRCLWGFNDMDLQNFSTQHAEINDRSLPLSHIKSSASPGDLQQSWRGSRSLCRPPPSNTDHLRSIPWMWPSGDIDRSHTHTHMLKLV